MMARAPVPPGVVALLAAVRQAIDAPGGLIAADFRFTAAPGRALLHLRGTVFAFQVAWKDARDERGTGADVKLAAPDDFRRLGGVAERHGRVFGAVRMARPIAMPTGTASGECLSDALVDELVRTLRRLLLPWGHRVRCAWPAVEIAHHVIDETHLWWHSQAMLPQPPVSADDSDADPMRRAMPAAHAIRRNEPQAPAVRLLGGERSECWERSHLCPRLPGGDICSKGCTQASGCRAPDPVARRQAMAARALARQAASIRAALDAQDVRGHAVLDRLLSDNRMHGVWRELVSLRPDGAPVYALSPPWPAEKVKHYRKMAREADAAGQTALAAQVRRLAAEEQARDRSNDWTHALTSTLFFAHRWATQQVSGARRDVMAASARELVMREVNVDTAQADEIMAKITPVASPYYFERTTGDPVARTVSVAILDHLHTVTGAWCAASAATIAAVATGGDAPRVDPARIITAAAAERKAAKMQSGSAILGNSLNAKGGLRIG